MTEGAAGKWPSYGNALVPFTNAEVEVLVPSLVHVKRGVSVRKPRIPTGVSATLFLLLLAVPAWGQQQQVSGTQPSVATGQSFTLGETGSLGFADNGNSNLLALQGPYALSQVATVQGFSFFVTDAAGELVLGMYTASKN